MYVNVPEGADAALRRACGDCHSNRTNRPRYSHIAPLSWVITDDVNQGRRHMNLDDWHPQGDPGKANELLADVCKEVRTSGMPPFSYRLLHRDIVLNVKEIESVCEWSVSFENNHPGKRTQP